MTQERFACPFCAELIMPDAIKCRFCHEWLSAHWSDLNERRSIQEIDRPETHQPSQRGTIGNLRKQYLATIDSVEGRSQPIEGIEHQTLGLSDPGDGYTDKVPDTVGSSDRAYSSAVENFRQDSKHAEKTQLKYRSLPYSYDSRNSRRDKSEAATELPQMQPEGKEIVKTSNKRVAKEVSSKDRPDSSSFRKKSGMPWLRAIMLTSYLGIIAALCVSESVTYLILRDAQAKENNQEYADAFVLYRGVVNSFPFSFGSIEARQGLRRLSQSQELEISELFWFSPIEHLLGSGVDASDVHLLPLIAWPVSTILLTFVFLTRISRPVIAFLALLLTAIAITGSVVQFAWYGSIPLPAVAETAREFMQATPVVYFASYCLLVLTILMTLTAKAKRISPQTSRPE